MSITSPPLAGEDSPVNYARPSAEFRRRGPDAGPIAFLGHCGAPLLRSV
ncbi:MAG: hypothetical protein OEM62_00830 [Acidobacteriota bacterium]|nr:hypothetical protein [Acidobacteriota bacterium]